MVRGCELQRALVAFRLKALDQERTVWESGKNPGANKDFGGSAKTGAAGGAQIGECAATISNLTFSKCNTKVTYCDVFHKHFSSTNLALPTWPAPWGAHK
jgi:hypothetical protein